MSTATMERSANGQKIEGQAPLWGDIDIPIIMGTGEFGQGKTLFGLTICPGPQTLVYDHEGSSLSYRSLDFDHVDMAREMLRQHPNGYTAEQRFLWWREDAMRRGQSGGRSGKYRVLMADPMSEIEDGLAEYIRNNITRFGLTSNQADKSPALFWGVMKKEWKFTLDKLRVHFDCLYGTVHLRDEFRGGAPTGVREPKGKETLFELASLFLWFEREKDKAGNVSAVPAATVLKSRLARTAFVNGEIQILPILPPRLPVATPKAIREYIVTPPDYNKLKPAERAKEHEMTKAEELAMQDRIAANQAAAAQAQLSYVERMNAAAKAQAERAAKTTPAPDAAASYAANQQEKAADSVPAMATKQQVANIQKLLPQAFADGPACAAWLKPWLAERNVAKIPELTESQAADLEVELCGLEAARKVESSAARGAELAAEKPNPDNARNLPATGTKPAGTRPTAETKADDVPFDVKPQPAKPVEPAAETIGPITDDQKKKIAVQMRAAFATPQLLEAGFVPILQKHGVARVGALNAKSAAAVIDDLQRIIDGKSAANAASAAGPESPGSITEEQLKRLRELSDRVGWPHDEQEKWLKQFGIPNFRGLSQRQADDRIEELLKVELGFASGVPGNS